MTVKNGANTASRFQEGNAGRPKGSKNRLTRERVESAQELFAPLVLVVIRRIKAHLRLHKAKEDCATCRHHITLVLEYSFGKPLQRHEVDIRAVRDKARRVAEAMGLDPGEVMDEAERIVREGR